MKEVGYYNGQIGELSKLLCPITDRAVYFGDGCYDAAFMENRVIFALEDHIKRFYNGCRLLRIHFPYSRQELWDILYGLVDVFDEEEGMLYWQTSRGSGVRDHVFPGEEARANLMAYLVPRKIAGKEKTFRCITVEDTRFGHCNIKTLNLLPNVMASQRAKEAGCDEVIFHKDGKVTEMAHSNVSFLMDGALVHRPFDEKMLPGISLKHLIRIAREARIPVQVREVSLAEAMNADELINTSSGTICNRICQVDGIQVGGRAEPLFRLLQDKVYKELTEYTKKGRHEKNIN